jgi:hypothetical protein
MHFLSLSKNASASVSSIAKNVSVKPGRGITKSCYWLCREAISVPTAAKAALRGLAVYGKILDYSENA